MHHILRSPRLEQLLAEARQRYDFIVLDTPPLLPVFDSALLRELVDGVLIVVAANQTPRKLLGEALNLLDPAKVLGIVFNRDARPLFGYYDAYYKDYFPDASEWRPEPEANSRDPMVTQTSGGNRHRSSRALRLAVRFRRRTRVLIGALAGGGVRTVVA